MGFPSIRNYVEADADGRTHTIYWTKSIISAPLTIGPWYDMSMLPGSPNVNDYPGSALVAQRLNYMSPGSIWHGPSQLPATKHLATMAIMNSVFTPATFMLCDYVLYYPMINTDTTALQVMDNTTTLGRFTDGKGLQMALITESTLGPNSAQIFVEYTNSDGVPGRTLSYAPWTPWTSGLTGYGMLASLGPTTYATGVPAVPFLPLQAGDLGVRSVQSIRFSVETGGGFCNLVLVEPIVSLCTPTGYLPTERNYIRDSMTVPKIHDEAYLSYLMLSGTNGNWGALVRGRLDIAWGP